MGMTKERDTSGIRGNLSCRPDTAAARVQGRPPRRRPSILELAPVAHLIDLGPDWSPTTLARFSHFEQSSVRHSANGVPPWPSRKRTPRVECP